MAGSTRPYFLTFKGIEHMVDANSPAAAVAHVVGEDVTGLRAAKGSEVSGWIRSGKAIEVAGVKPAPLAPAAPGYDAIVLDTNFTGDFSTDDARDWIAANSTPAPAGEFNTALLVFDRMRTHSAMTLNDFDEMSMAMPLFSDVIVAYFAQRPQIADTSEILDVMDFREQLAKHTMHIGIVLNAIRREVIPDERVAAGTAPVPGSEPAGIGSSDA